MTLSRILVVALSIAGVQNATAQGANPAQGGSRAMSIILRAEHDNVKTGIPITLKATLTNRSDHEITIGYDRNRGIFEVDVFDESGKFAPDKRPGYHNGRVDLEQLARTMSPEELIKSGLLTSNFVWTTLKAGETVSETIEVSKYYDMTKPGAYKVLIQHPDPETKIILKSSPIDLTVTK